MSRKASSSSPTPTSRPTKRQKVDHLTYESFKNGVVLAPMVRSGSLPTRLFALKHGATLVWSPEIVDKAILRAEREVDSKTGVISYNGVTKAIFTTHPIEKPYLIYQIGSADPDLAVQAARTVMQDISGVDLNCGCPKPFSTHAGMGAALLTNPDLLCSILTALRQAMPPEITVSAKIRLLPTQEETLRLIERIVNTGITNLTVHCRTRNMRPREKAHIERMREIVEFVEKMEKGVSIIENGDCLSREDAIRIRNITGAHSCMIATAAESNPTCFSPNPLVDLEKSFIPQYIRLGKYLDNHFSSTKFCAMSFKGSHKELKRADRVKFRDSLSRAKSYEDLDELLDGLWNGDKEIEEISESIKLRVNGVLYPLDPPPTLKAQLDLEEKSYEKIIQGAILCKTPQKVEKASEALYVDEHSDRAAEEALPISTPPEKRENPELAALATPKLPLNERLAALPALVSGQDLPTPTPTPGPGSCSFA